MYPVSHPERSRRVATRGFSGRWAPSCLQTGFCRKERWLLLVAEQNWRGSYALPSRRLQRAQEVQDVLNLRRAEHFEVADHAVGFRATVALVGPVIIRCSTVVTAKTAVVGTTVVVDRLQQIGCAPIMQEEQTLADSP